MHTSIEIGNATLVKSKDKTAEIKEENKLVPPHKEETETQVGREQTNLKKFTSDQ